MGYLDAALEVAGAFGRGYDQFRRHAQPGHRPGQPQQQPQRPQDQNGGLLGLGLNYMRNRHDAGQEKQANAQINSGGVPDGTIPIGPMGAGIGNATPPAPVPGPMGVNPAAPPPNFVGDTQGPAAPQPNVYPEEPMDPTAPPSDGMRYASGGLVTRPTTAILGESGPEMVVPLTGRPNNKVSMANLRLGMNYRR